MKLTVLSWNIHKGIGGIDRRYRLERVIEVIRHHDPDVALLQEVAEDFWRTDRDRQVDVIGDALGLPHRYFVPIHRYVTSGQYGNAILCRWPLHDLDLIDLTVGNRKRRGALVARTRFRTQRGTQTVALCCLHLGLVGAERDTQLARLVSAKPVTTLRPKTPFVVGGDFNDVWADLGPKFMEPAGFRRAGGPAKTFPAAFPARPLDAIFVRGTLDVKSCKTSGLKVARAASDHLPLIARFKIDPY